MSQQARLLIIAEAQDRASATLAHMSQNIGQIDKKAIAASLTTNRLATSLAKLDTAASQAAAAKDRAARAANTLAASNNKATTSAGSAASSLNKMAVAAGALMGAFVAYKVAVEGVISKSIQLAGWQEQIKIAFETMMGSARAADQTIRELYTFAKRTPFQVKEVVDATRLLKAYGFEASQLIPTLRAVGDAAAGLGLGGEGVQRIVIALGQMRAKGALAGEEMRQLAQAGIPAWEMLAKIIGVDIPTAMKMAEERAIPAVSVIDKLVTAIGERFPNLMEKQAKTLLGLWSNLQDQATLSFIAIGDAIVKGLDIKDRLAGVIGMMERVTDVISEKGLAGALRELVPPELQAVLVALAGALGAALVAAAVAATIAIGGLLAPVAGLMAAGAALALAWQQDWLGMRTITTRAIEDIITELGEMRAYLAGTRDDVSEQTRGMAQAWALTSQPIKALPSVMKFAWGVMSGDLSAMREGIRGVSDTTDELRAAFDRDFAQIRAATEETTRKFKTETDFWVSIFGDAARGIKGHMGAIKEALRAPDMRTWEEKFRDANKALVDETKQLQEQAEAVDKARFQFYHDQSTLETQLAKQLEESAKRAGAEADRAVSKYEALVRSMVNAFLPALIATHPAMLAANAAIAEWKERIEGVNLAILANQDQMKAAQAEYDRMAEHLAGLNKELDATRAKLAELSNPKLTGMGEMENKIAAVTKHIQRLQMAGATGLSIEEITKQFPILTAGMEDYIKGLPEAVRGSADFARIFLQQLQLVKGLKFDEQLALIGKAAGDAKKEMDYADVIKQIGETKARIGELTGQINAQEEAMKAQKLVIEGIREQGEILNQTLRDYQTELRKAEDRQRDLNQALKDAYDWLINDREKIVELGGEAATQAGIIDDKMRELLAAIQGYAKGVSKDVSGVIAAARNEIDLLKAAIAKLKLEIGGGGEGDGSYRASGMMGAETSVNRAGAIAGNASWFRAGLMGGAFDAQIKTAMERYVAAFAAAQGNLDAQARAEAELLAAMDAVKREYHRTQRELEWWNGILRERSAQERKDAEERARYAWMQSSQYLLEIARSQVIAWTEQATKIPGISFENAMNQVGLPGGTSRVPSMAAGGIVPGSLGEPRLILAHGGESVKPPGSGVTIIINNPIVWSEEDKRRLADDINRRIGTKTAGGLRN